MVSGLSNCEAVDMAQRLIPAEKREQIGQRVRRFRAAFARTQREICDRFEVETQTWSHYEKGRLPPEDLMDQFYAVHGVAPDYFRKGSYVGMDRPAIEALERTPIPERRTNQKRVTAKISA